MARLDMASFLRGLAIGLGLQPGASRRGDREAEAYRAGLKGRSHETLNRSELGAWFQGIGDHAGSA
jgi:ribosome modulation factor